MSTEELKVIKENFDLKFAIIMKTSRLDSLKLINRIQELEDKVQKLEERDL